MDETLRFFLEVRDKNPGAFRRYQTEARTAFQNVQREIDTSARSADRLDRSLRRLPSSRNIAIRVLDYSSTGIRRIESGLARLRGVAQGAALAIGVGGGVGLTAAIAGVVNEGRQFNKMMEDARLTLRMSIGGYDEFRGKQKKAAEATAELVQWLDKLAVKTPFKMSDLVELSAGLAAYQIPLKDMKESLEAIATVQAAHPSQTGLIQQITLAYGQMLSAGKVFGGEVRQLQTAGIPAIKILKEELNLSADEAAKIGEQQIDSITAIRAINKNVMEMYPGALQKLSRTATGLESTFEDYKEQISGLLMAPIHEWEKDALQRLNPAMDRIRKKLAADPNMTFEARMQLIWDEVNKTGVPTEIKDAVIDALQYAGKLGARAMWEGFKSAPLWAQGIVGAWMAAKFMPTGLLGKLGTTKGPGALLSPGATPARPMFVSVVGGGLGGVPGVGGFGTTVAGGATTAAAAARAAGVAIPGIGIIGAGGSGGLASIGAAASAHPFAAFAAPILAGMLIDELDKKFNFTGANPGAAERARTINESVIRSRTGGDGLSGLLSTRQRNAAESKFTPFVEAATFRRNQNMALKPIGAKDAIRRGIAAAGKSVYGADQIASQLAELERAGMIARGSTEGFIGQFFGGYLKAPQAFRDHAQAAGVAKGRQMLQAGGVKGTSAGSIIDDPGKLLKPGGGNKTFAAAALLPSTNQKSEISKRLAKDIDEIWTKAVKADKGTAQAASTAVREFAAGVAAGKGELAKSTEALTSGALVALAKVPAKSRKMAEESIAVMTAELEAKKRLPEGSTDKMVKAIEGKYGRLKPLAKRNVDAALGPVEQRFQTTTRKVIAATSDMTQEVGTGMRLMARMLNQFMGASGPGDYTLNLPDGGGSGGGAFARGGRVPGIARGDHLALLARGGGIAGIVDGGELVMNRHTERKLDTLLKPYGVSVAEMVQRETTPHYATGGRIADAKAWSEAQMGKPYVWGAGHSYGTWPAYDCSGFATNSGTRAGYTGGIGTTYDSYAKSKRGKGPVMFGFSHFGAKGLEGPGHMGIHILGETYQFGNPGHKGGSFPEWRVPAGMEGASFNVRVPFLTGPAGDFRDTGNGYLKSGGNAANARLKAWINGMAGPSTGPAQADREISDVLGSVGRGVRWGGAWGSGGLFTAHGPTLFLAGERGTEDVGIVPRYATGGRLGTPDSASSKRAVAAALGIPSDIAKPLNSLLSAIAGGKLQQITARLEKAMDVADEYISRMQERVDRRVANVRARTGVGPDSSLLERIQLTTYGKTIDDMQATRTRLRQIAAAARAKKRTSVAKELEERARGLEGDIDAMRVSRSDLLRDIYTGRVDRLNTQGDRRLRRADATINLRGLGPDSEEAINLQQVAQLQNLRKMEAERRRTKAQLSAELRKRPAQRDKSLVTAMQAQLRDLDDTLMEARGQFKADLKSNAERLAEAVRTAHLDVISTLQDGIDFAGGRANLAGGKVTETQLRQELAGTSFAAFADLRSKQGSLTADQRSQLYASRDAMNMELQRQIDQLRTQETSVRGALATGDLSAQERLTWETQLQDVVNAILGLQVSIKENSDQAAELTDATQDQTSTIRQAAGGSIAFSFRGQSYLVGQSSDNLANAGVGA